MYRFLYSKRWLAALAIVVVFGVTCVELGLWQLRRLDERKKLNAAISSHIHLPVIPVSLMLEPCFSRALARDSSNLGVVNRHLMSCPALSTVSACSMT